MATRSSQCRVVGCINPPWEREVCGMHYLRFKELGFSDLIDGKLKCKKCDRPARAKGLCHKHYNYSLIGERPNRSEAALIRERKKREEIENSPCKFNCGRDYHERPAIAEQMFNWTDCPGTPRKKRKPKK